MRETILDHCGFSRLPFGKDIDEGNIFHNEEITRTAAMLELGIESEDVMLLSNPIGCGRSLIIRHGLEVAHRKEKLFSFFWFVDSWNYRRFTCGNSEHLQRERFSVKFRKLPPVGELLLAGNTIPSCTSVENHFDIRRDCQNYHHMLVPYLIVHVMV